MSQSFNRLSNAESERLALLAEECAEVIQAITKILRHGYRSCDPTETNGSDNRRKLENEIGDVEFAINEMIDRRDIDSVNIVSSKLRKEKKWARYSHHQHEIKP